MGKKADANSSEWRLLDSWSAGFVVGSIRGLLDSWSARFVAFEGV